MAKNWNLQDIKPPERNKKRRGSAPQNVSDIAIKQNPSRSTQKEPPETITHGFDEEVGAIDSVEIVDGRGRRFKKVIISTIIIIVLFGASFVATSLLRGADVSVHPKFKDVNVAASFTAHMTPQADELAYSLLTLEEDAERTVTADGQQEVSERATGNIVIFNEFSTSPQRLIKNTRFESPEGLIFRISDSVMVPGYTTNEAGETVPGALEAEVFADGTGEQYNVGASRFTIPGLKGTDQFDAMYATSDTPFTGGFEGLTFVLNDEEVATTRQQLQTELRDKLLERLPNERPAGVEIFDGAITFQYDSLPSTQGTGGTAVIKEKTTLIMPIFQDSDFAEYLAASTVAGYEHVPIRIEDSSLIRFTYPATTTENISTIDKISFDLRGNIRLIWVFDKELLRKDLAGLAKTALPTVLSGYPAIERAEAIIRPFWKQSFPENVEEIEIIEIIDDSA